jgi:hypothetical protein
MRRIPTAWLASLGLVLAPEAAAHANLGELAPFWAGAFHVVLTPLAMAALVGLAAATVVTSEALQFEVALLCSATAFAAAAIAPLRLVPAAPVGAALAGVAAVLAWAPRRLGAWTLAFAAALTVGLGARPETPDAWEALGSGAASGLLVLWLHDGLRRLERRAPLLRRVLGAWVAAIALLLGALAAAALCGGARVCFAERGYSCTPAPSVTTMRRALSRATSIDAPRASATPMRRRPRTSGLPNSRSCVSGSASAAPTLPKRRLVLSPSTSSAQDADEPC